MFKRRLFKNIHLDKMANTNQAPFNRILTGGSKIPIFTGKPSDFGPWLAALKKKERIYQLTDSELVNLAYDFTDGLVSEMIGEFLDDHPNCTSKDLLDQIAAQYGEFTNAADAARALIRIKQDRGEVLADLASRMNKIAKLAYRDAEMREGPAVQVHLAEFFIDALNNSFIKEDVVRSNPTTLSEALSAARQSEMLYERLQSGHKKEQAFLNNSFNRYQGPRGAPIRFRVPKSEPNSSCNAVRYKFCGCASARLQRGRSSYNRLERDWQCAPEERSNNFTSGKSKVKLHSKPTHHRPPQRSNTRTCNHDKPSKKGVTLGRINTRGHGCLESRESRPKRAHQKNKSVKKTRENKETQRNKIHNQSSGMECIVKIRGRPIEALIDTGS